MAQRDDARLAVRGKRQWTMVYFFVLYFFFFLPLVRFFSSLFCTTNYDLWFKLDCHCMYGMGNGDDEAAATGTRDNEWWTWARESETQVCLFTLFYIYSTNWLFTVYPIITHTTYDAPLSLAKVKTGTRVSLDMTTLTRTIMRISPREVIFLFTRWVWKIRGAHRSLASEV